MCQQGVTIHGASPLDAADAADPLRQLRSRGENMLLRQLDMVLAFAETQGEQIEAAYEVIHAHGQARNGPPNLPSWLEHYPEVPGNFVLKLDLPQQS